MCNSEPPASGSSRSRQARTWTRSIPAAAAMSPSLAALEWGGCGNGGESQVVGIETEEMLEPADRPQRGPMSDHTSDPHPATDVPERSGAAPRALPEVLDAIADVEGWLTDAHAARPRHPDTPVSTGARNREIGH